MSCYVPRGIKGQLSYQVWQSWITWNHVYLILSYILWAESSNLKWFPEAEMFSFVVRLLMIMMMPCQYCHESLQNLVTWRQCSHVSLQRTSQCRVFSSQAKAVMARNHFTTGNNRICAKLFRIFYWSEISMMSHYSGACKHQIYQFYRHSVPMHDLHVT